MPITPMHPFPTLFTKITLLLERKLLYSYTKSVADLPHSTKYGVMIVQDYVSETYTCIPSLIQASLD